MSRQVDAVFQNIPMETTFCVFDNEGDYLRVLTLVKGGGTYADSDFIFLKPLDMYNFTVQEQTGHGFVANGMIR